MAEDITRSKEPGAYDDPKPWPLEQFMEEIEVLYKSRNTVLKERSDKKTISSEERALFEFRMRRLAALGAYMREQIKLRDAGFGGVAAKTIASQEVLKIHDNPDSTLNKMRMGAEDSAPAADELDDW